MHSSHQSRCKDPARQRIFREVRTDLLAFGICLASLGLLPRGDLLATKHQTNRTTLKQETVNETRLSGLITSASASKSVTVLLREQPVQKRMDLRRRANPKISDLVIKN